MTVHESMNDHLCSCEPPLLLMLPPLPRTPRISVNHKDATCTWLKKSAPVSDLAGPKHSDRADRNRATRPTILWQAPRALTRAARQRWGPAPTEPPWHGTAHVSADETLAKAVSRPPRLRGS